MLAFASIAAFLSLSSLAAAQCGTAGQWTYINGQTQLATLSACTAVQGSLSITGVTSLAPLATLQSVQLSLDITGNSITDLTGLGALATVGEQFFIHSNGNLTSLNGLTGLRTITGGLFIYDCDSLTSISALSGLTNINPGQSPVYAFGLSVYRNKLLASLDGLQGLKTYGNALVIDNLPKLTSLAPVGSGGPISAPGAISLVNLTGVTDISSLKGFTTNASSTANTKTSLTLSGLGVTTLTGLDNINKVGNLTITNNAKLSDISVLARGGSNSTLPTIEGPVLIKNNSALCDFKGLNVSLVSSLGANAVIESSCGSRSGSGPGASGSSNASWRAASPVSTLASWVFTVLATLGAALTVTML
ncbi:hypothetical protein BJ742DRAFT_894151 [Cladochytrium replicatum]|nr:hypothetical protein BJ742DRAFT_894151 [Cladochytrium replicatum]